MMQGVADGIGDDGLARDPRKLELEPRPQPDDKWSAAFLAHDAARIGATAADRLLDRIECGDAFERLAGDRRVAVFGDIEELAPQMRPAEGERDRLLAGSAGNRLIGGISVALHDAAIGPEELKRMDRSATGSVAVGDRRRVGSAPGPVVAGDGPEVSLLDAAAAGIEHRRHRLVDRDPARGQNDLAQPQIDRLQLGGGVAHPERQDRTLDVEALGDEHLGLPIERQVPGIFGDQHGGDHRLGRQPALDQPFRRRRLHHRLGAGPAGILRTVGDDHPVLRRDHVEPLRGILADHTHGRAATGAVAVVGLDRHMHPRQMAGKRATIDTALVGAGTRGHLVLFVVVGLVGRNHLLDVLERQTQLLGVELLRMAAKLRTLQLAQQVPQAVVLRQGMVALHERGVTLRPRRSDQRMQGCDIGWKRIGALAHAREESDSRPSVDTQSAA